MGKKIALCQSADTAASIITKPTTIEGKMQILEDKLRAITAAFNAMKTQLGHKEDQLETFDVYTKNVQSNKPKTKVNKDNIPVNTSLIGITRGVPYTLTISGDGSYYVGITKFQSLSAAAQAVSGVRRSGWVFWKLANGKTVKETYSR